ncbi:hypothetical protein O181_104931 [Austropuccinia psidii MF-1]|uniref:Transmembrane protein n=1 Tax=Austropuccinia psidii MF-1 TaxID=1389203 RepID=A0A9Q3JN58_9BASI|nr:hypothetical protein [Austropuccinia psidii MF-1]
MDHQISLSINLLSDLKPSYNPTNCLPSLKISHPNQSIPQPLTSCPILPKSSTHLDSISLFNLESNPQISFPSSLSSTYSPPAFQRNLSSLNSSRHSQNYRLRPPNLFQSTQNYSTLANSPQFPHHPSKPLPRTKQLFWWGFSFPPLWLYGAIHLIPYFQKRWTYSRNLSQSSQTKNFQNQILSKFSTYKNLLTKGEVQIGTASVIITSRSDHKLQNPYYFSSDLAWSQTCISSAEQLDSLGISSADWIRPGQLDINLNKYEQKGAIQCLIAFSCFIILITAAVVISQKVHWSSHLLSHVSSNSDQSSNINNNLLGASTSSSPL